MAHERGQWEREMKMREEAQTQCINNGIASKNKAKRRIWNGKIWKLMKYGDNEISGIIICERKK